MPNLDGTSEVIQYHSSCLAHSHIVTLVSGLRPAFLRLYTIQQQTRIAEPAQGACWLITCSRSTAWRTPERRIQNTAHNLSTTRSYMPMPMPMPRHIHASPSHQSLSYIGAASYAQWLRHELVLDTSSETPGERTQGGKGEEGDRRGQKGAQRGDELQARGIHASCGLVLP